MIPSEGGVLAAEGGRVPSGGAAFRGRRHAFRGRQSIFSYGDMMPSKAFYILRAARRLQRAASCIRRKPEKISCHSGRQDTF